MRDRLSSEFEVVYLKLCFVVTEYFFSTCVLEMSVADADAQAALAAVLAREQATARRSQELITRAPLLSHLVMGRDDVDYNFWVRSHTFQEESPLLGPTWRHGTKLPSYAIHTQPPSSNEILRLYPRSDYERAPVLPTLFLPGFPKSATSWLYQCFKRAFHPDTVGCGPSAASWAADECKHRFALTVLSVGEMEESSACMWSS